MPNFWKIVNEVIEKSDIVLEVLDARFAEQTRNNEIEEKVKACNKQIIYVLNKCDLAGKETAEKEKKALHPSVFVSATKRLGITMLLHLIQRYSERRKAKVIVGVVGYPNTGKSSVINALKGKSSASVSPQSGHTKGLQLIRVTSRIYLLDTPGVYPYMEKNREKHAIIGLVDYTKISSPEEAVFAIMKSMPGTIERFYGVEHGEPEDVLDAIALKLKHLKKGGKPDTERTARTILKDWQTGRIMA